MAELLAKEPLFKGKNEVDQLDKVIIISYVVISDISFIYIYFQLIFWMMDF